MSIAFSPMGDLWVAEVAGRRIQCFNSSGRSKTIFKSKRYVEWIGITSRNEIATFGRLTTFYSRKLLDIRNNKGKLLRRIGIYHDKSKVSMTAESLIFAMDDDDNFYAANVRTPVIRKYSSEGRLLMAITFETPAKTPSRITLNEAGDEIKRLDDGD
ncbi:MAG: hypothetical protein GY940_39305, partial [bacterium]|nr:hypothetical protein [bacterium]